MKLADPPRYEATPTRCVVAQCTNPVRAGLVCDAHAEALHSALQRPVPPVEFSHLEGDDAA